ncbi:methyltransferase domain-containing protein [Rhizophagus clarus]|uniref:Arsenite methyltransferase n=1 Tax=Rhizophagus clarus TaxID=94130 RepID=A0A8H3QIG2_9GLOM|nr:methyltransferase domain-containing protein [Rhizophagus clarus]
MDSNNKTCCFKDQTKTRKEQTSNEQTTIESVKDYYGNILKTNKDLKTSACCAKDTIPENVKAIMKDIHPEVLSKFYGCGSPVPPALKGKVVLDLGSGSGRDCFILSKLVGSEGKVIGVDMTDEQLEVANSHITYHMERFGYDKPNVIFKKGYIEELQAAGIEDESVDVVISNCVLNLSANKRQAFSEIFRVLKPGGELYFSDVFSDRRIPEALIKDPVLFGECLSGALYIEDFRRLLTSLGYPDYRILSKQKIELMNSEIKQKVGMIDFYSITLRTFKLPFEDRCENYGQLAIYKGTIEEAPDSFVLDDHHEFKVNESIPVCSNTAAMLQKTRYAEHFNIIGDTTSHYGIFSCSPKSDSSCC